MSKTTIEYKGVVTNVEAGHSAVIKCNGFKMQDEIVVTAGEGGGITPSGTLTVVTNGLKDVTQFAKVYVNVPTESNGIPIELTEEEFAAILANPTADMVGKIYSINGQLFTIVKESDE